MRQERTCVDAIWLTFLGMRGSRPRAIERNERPWYRFSIEIGEGTEVKINLNLGMTELLAFWGAIISTIALVWNIIRGALDRRKLSVAGYVGNILPSEEPRKIVFYVVMANTGRRPIVITNYGIIPKLKKGESQHTRTLIIPKGLPKLLNEGQYHIEYTGNVDFEGREIKGVYALDSSGKEWKAKRKNIKLLKKNLQKTRKAQVA